MIQDDLKIISCDFDGTLAERVWPDPGIGAEIPGGKEFLERARAEGYQIVIYTARVEPYFQEMENWLLAHKIPYDRAEKKILATVYIDDRAVKFDGYWQEVTKEVFGE